jgi:hypothetical protein
MGRPALEHDPEKWMPVFRKDHAPTKKLDHDPIQFDRVMVSNERGANAGSARPPPAMTTPYYGTGTRFFAIATK